MPERNAHIPFPELMRPAGTLEGLIVDMAHGNLLPFSQLPQTLTATNLETYTNWVSELTEKDPRKAERGAVLHVGANRQIIFPSNPRVSRIGDEKNLAFDDLQGEDNNFYALDIHAHPIDVASSNRDTTFLLTGFRNYIPPAMLIATPEHNYLVIKSQETSTRPSSRLDIKSKEDALFSLKEYFAYLGVFYDMIDALGIKRQKGLIEQYLGMDVLEFYFNFVNTMNLSKEFYLGFYRSEGDGTYVRMTQEMVMEQLMQKREEVVNAIKTGLTQT